MKQGKIKQEHTSAQVIAKRSEGLSQPAVPAIPAISSYPVQRRIENIASWDDFVTAYKTRNNDEEPSGMLRTSIEAVIVEEHDYNYEDAFERAMELAMTEHADEVEYQTCYIRLADLVPQLDPQQHRPGLVTHNAEEGTITQTPTDELGSTHYRPDGLQGVYNTQIVPAEERAEAVSILFEIISENADVPITTADGRHRIAVYSAMGVPRIRADITASQRERLVARGITVSDNDAD